MKTRDFSGMILASASPRRQELIALLGLDFRVVPAEVEETPLPGESAPDYVLRLAEEKAQWVAAQQGTKSLIIAADTTVVKDGLIFGKPTDEIDAERMLRELRGKMHQVYSGIAVTRHGEMLRDLCKTDVPMRHYSEMEIQAYIDSRDPLDKAGAYAIQHAGFHPVEDLNGCFANVMGLPLCHITRTLLKLGVTINQNVPKACQDHIDYACPVFQSILL